MTTDYLALADSGFKQFDIELREAIRTLVAERDALAMTVAGLSKQVQITSAQAIELMADAKRYRAIREGLEVDQNHVGAAGIVVSLVDDFGGETLNGDAADSAIDAAMSAKETL